MSKKVKLRAKYRMLKRGFTTKIHLASSSAEFALAFHLSPGNNHDAPVGGTLNKNIVSYDNHSLLMDHAYEDEATRQADLDSGFISVVLPKRNRKKPWDYDKELYKRRNEIERFFRRLKRFRKVVTRYDKCYAANLFSKYIENCA